MDLTQILMDIFNTIPWKTIIGIMVATICIAVLKRYYDNISSYFLFRSNKDLGKNVKVLINGKEGYIVHITWRFIYVKISESGNEMIIPITKWSDQKWEIFKNGNK